MQTVRRLCHPLLCNGDLLRIDLHKPCITNLQGCAIQRQVYRRLHTCSLGHARGTLAGAGLSDSEQASLIASRGESRNKTREYHQIDRRQDLRRASAAVHLWQQPQWHHLPASAGFHSTSTLSAQLARKPKQKEQGSAEAASTSGAKSAEDTQKDIARAKTGGRYQLPPVMMGANQVKLAPISPNVIAEPYKGELPPLPLVSWVTLTGLRERWRRTMGGVKAMYTLARCRKYVPGFSLPAFKADALRLYEEVCQGIAVDDKTLLRQRMTPAAYGTVKTQLKAREEGGWKRVAWALARRPQLHELELVHARLIAANPKDPRSSFAQLTVRIRAAHKFAAYDGKRRLVAGDPEKELPVQDVWVLERSFREEPTSRWRVAGRLSLPPAPAPTEKWWNPLGWVRRLRPAPSVGTRHTAAQLQA